MFGFGLVWCYGQVTVRLGLVSELGLGVGLGCKYVWGYGYGWSKPYPKP